MKPHAFANQRMSFPAAAIAPAPAALHGDSFSAVH
jgi:hypothetical protein